MLYNLRNARKGNYARPTMGVNYDGQIHLSKTLVEQLDLKPGDRVSIYQPNDTPQKWFLIIGDEHGFPLRKKGPGLAFNCKACAEDLHTCFNIDDFYLSLWVETGNQFKVKIPIPNNSIAYELIKL